jgi:hypothetical protein
VTDILILTWGILIGPRLKHCAMELVVHPSEIGYEYAKKVKMFEVRVHS